MTPVQLDKARYIDLRRLALYLRAVHPSDYPLARILTVIVLRALHGGH